MRLDPRSSDAFTMLGFALRSSGFNERAYRAMEHAIALNPNNPLPYYGLAFSEVLFGRPELAKPLLARAFQLSPREPFAALWHFLGGFASYLMGEDEAAVEAARNAIAGNPRYSSPHFLLAAASAQLGREAEARAALADYLRLAPEQATIPKLLPVVDLSDHPTYQRQLQRLVEGLRKAGLPE